MSQCACGCGRDTNISKRTDRPTKYINGHGRSIPFDKRFAIDIETGCWNWLLYVMPNGYGKYRRNCAHRFVYETLKGKIEEGLTLDHLCRNRRCVNPSHLEPVTYQVNLLRAPTVTAKNASKTHCLRGHPFDSKNTAIKSGSRFCRACDVIRHREYKRRKQNVVV